MRRLANNAGYKGDVIVEGVRDRQQEQNNPNVGFNVLSGEYEDMIKAGVIDPVKVTRGALENAASIAAMILSTDALIADKPEKKDGQRGNGMGDMDDMGF